MAGVWDKLNSHSGPSQLSPQRARLTVPLDELPSPQRSPLSLVTLVFYVLNLVSSPNTIILIPKLLLKHPPNY